MACIKEESLQYYQSVLVKDSSSKVNVVISYGGPDSPPTKRMKGLAAFIKHVIDDLEENIPAAATSPLQKIEKEISFYLEYPSLKADADPLV